MKTFGWIVFAIATCILAARALLHAVASAYLSWFAYDHVRAGESRLFNGFVAISILCSWGIVDIIGRSVRELRRP